MRIVQTFWTAGSDPLRNSFGWTHPEFNLMSWALSCLSLRKHYNEVALYTDEQGKHVLIDLLHLPYTEVNIVYDEHLCMAQHWAFAKIKTYSMQSKPFLHVDGDVYLPNPIPENVLNAAIIAQNREVGTSYYKNMIDRIFSISGIKLPDCITKRVRGGSIPSYNMGVFGGHDLTFIHKYSSKSLQLYKENEECAANGNLNVLLEQIFMAICREQEDVAVTTLIPKDINDNGYMMGEFCALDRFQQYSLHHILGGHKKRKDVIHSLRRRLLIESPVIYKKIVNLFPTQHPRLSFNEDLLVLAPLNSNNIAEYFSFVERAEKSWTKIVKDDLVEYELKNALDRDSLLSVTNLAESSVCCHPQLKCFTVSETWGDPEREKFRKYLSIGDKDMPVQYIVIVPSLYRELHRTLLVQDLDKQILDFIGGNIINVRRLIKGVVSTKPSLDEDGCAKLILSEIRMLIQNNIINLVN